MSVLALSSIPPFSVACVPVSCIDNDFKTSPAEASAQVTLTANKAVDSWSFSKTAGDTAITGSTASGLTTDLTLTATAIGTKSSTYDITATLGARTVVTSVSLTAIMDA